MLVAYVAAEGELASDVGAGAAGPYSSVLAEEIVKPGVEAVTMFRNVERRVPAAIKQKLYLGFSALGDVYLAGLAGAACAPASAGPPSQTGTTRQLHNCRLEVRDQFQEKNHGRRQQRAL